MWPLLADFTSDEEASELESAVKNYIARYENIVSRTAECGVLLRQVIIIHMVLLKDLGERERARERKFVTNVTSVNCKLHFMSFGCLPPTRNMRWINCIKMWDFLRTVCAIYYLPYVKVRRNISFFTK